MKKLLLLLLLSSPAYAIEQSRSMGGPISVTSLTIGSGVALTTAPVSCASGSTLAGTLASGTSFQYLTSPSSMTLTYIGATVGVAGVGGSGDTIKCNDSTGNGISVTLGAAAAAGTNAETFTQAVISANAKVSCHIESGATTRPIANILLCWTTR